MERKTSLAARLQLLGCTSQPSSSQGDDQPTTGTHQAAGAGPAVAPPQQQKRRLPGWLTAPPPEPQPAAADVPAAEQSRPKVSIRARVAAQAPSAVGGAAASFAPIPAAAGALAAAQAGATGAPPAAAASNTAGAGGAGYQGFNEGPKTSLASLLLKPRTYSPMVLAPAAAVAAVAPAAEAAAGPTGGAGATQQQAPQQHKVLQQPRPLPARRRLPASLAAAAAAAGTAAAATAGSAGNSGSTPSKSSQQQQQSEDSLWSSEDELQQDRQQQAAPRAAPRKQQQQQQQQQQESQQQEERQLTLQQRQAQQMAQLGLKLPGAGAAADEDAWLAGVFAGAAAVGGSGGSSRRQQGRKQAGGGSGGGGAAAAAGSGGSSRMQQGSNAGAGSGGRAKIGVRAAAGIVPPKTGQADAAAAAGADAAGVEGSTHAPLVLFDAESNLRLQVPGSINQHLRSYQRQGVEFLFSRYAAGSGGVLCDDMGLGKTVQAISFIAALLGKQGTPQDTLPRSFAAFRHQRQQARAQRRQLHAPGRGKAGGVPAAGGAASPAARSDDGDDEDEEEEEEEGQDEVEEEDVEDAGSTIRWPVLVVCPTSVLDNWMRELDMWGTFKAVKYNGPPAARAAIADEASGGQYEVILTSYDTLRVDAPALNALHPHALIFDEAHKLKNSKSKQYEAAQSLNTKYRFALSGTIMQNDWDELYAVLDLLCPYCLGEYGGYVEYYSKPIKRGQSSTASNYEKVKGEKRLKQLVDVVKQVTLRRTKAIIADQLPRKTDNVVFCQLQPLQYRAYDRTLASPDLQALRMAKSPCDCGSGAKSAECCYEMVPAAEGGVLWPHYHCCDCRVEGCKRHRPYGCREYYESMGYTNVRLACPYCLMLGAISLLTKISNHLDLIRPDAKLEQQDERQFQYELAVASMVLADDADKLGGLLANSSGWLGASDETHCGKMATLKMLLQTWAGDYSSHNKVLLFSHSTRCLDLLEAFVQRQGWDYVRLDGSTPQKLRQGICDEFNNRPSIFLLLMSTVAGGLGLNLTAANKVVVFDPSWNPAHDLQAQDRAYRLGQTRDVAVYRLVGTGTLEEAVYKRQIYKQQQANMVIDGAQEPRYWEGVQGDKEKTGELWGLWNLLRFSGQTVETRDILRAYKGRHRQQVEQQLQDDARRQLQEQQQGGQGTHAVVPSGAGAGGASAGAAAKPFQIVVLDQLVGSAGDDEDPGLEGLLVEEGEGAAGSSRRRSKQGSRKRHSSDDAAAAAAAGGAVGVAAGEGAAAGTSVGGIAAADEAWCHESLLDVLLDDLLPQEGSAGQQQQQQHGPKRQRLRAVLTDSDGEGEGEEAAAAAGQVPVRQLAGHLGLSPVAEGWAEGEVGSDEAMEDSMGGQEQMSDDSAGGSARSADGIAQPVVGVDPVLAVLEEQGTILHVHRHEKVLGKARNPTAGRQHTQQASSRQRRSSSKHIPASQQQQTQQHPRHQGGRQPLSSIVRGSVAQAYQQCSQADAAEADAAARQGWGPVASLAVWQGVTVAEMALWLLQQTPEQRQQLLAMYAKDMQSG